MMSAIAINNQNVLSKLRDIMQRLHVECFIIPTADPHLSEYIAPFYKTREFITGFTGSAGIYASPSPSPQVPLSLR